MMSRVVSELRLAARNLSRSPGFAATASLILAVGIGSATAIYTVVDGILLEPLPLPDADEIVVVCERHPSIAEYCVGSAPTMSDIGHRSATLESVGLARGWTFDVRDPAGDRRMALRAGLATSGFFEVMAEAPAAGRLFAPDEVGEDANVVLLGHEAWTTWFGADPGVVGRSLTVDGTPHVVVGVLPEGFELPTLPGIQLWRPLHFDPTDEERRSWRGFEIVGRLAEGRDVDEAASELEGIYATLRLESEAVTEQWSLEVMPLERWVVADVRPALLVFIGAVGLLLLIACANVANLLLVRSARRSREMAVRAALGAGRADLAGGVLAESAILSSVGGALGLALAWAGTRAFLALAPGGIPRLEDVSALDGEAFAFALGVSALTVLLFGLLPAVRTSGADLSDSLRGSSARAGERGGRLRRTLVTAELALAVVLLTTAGLLARSFAGFVAWEPGFEREGLAAVSVYFPPEMLGPDGVRPWLVRAEEAALAVPGVESVAFASSIPLLGGNEAVAYRLAEREAVADEDLPRARVFDVSPTYFATLGVRVTRGRAFSEQDGAGAAQALVVNETFAGTAWPGEDPVGRHLVVPGGVWADEDVEYTVVGVVSDVRPLTPGESPEPEAYRTNRQYARIFPYLLLRASGDAGAAALRVAEALTAAVSPDLSVSVQGTMPALMDARLVRPRFDMALIGVFAAAALLLTVVGIYGVLAFAVVQRRREMGIRLALGSGRDRVVRTVVGDGLRMAAVGLAAGLFGSAAVADLVRGVVHGVTPTDPATLGLTAGLVALMAGAASIVPAVRASLVDPVGLLRED